MKKTPEFHAFTKLALVVVLGALAAVGTACGSSNSTGGTGGAGGGGGSGSGTGGAPADNARYNFEMDTQSWISGSVTSAFASVMTSTAQHFAGAQSLAGMIMTDAPLGDPYSLEIVLSPPLMIPGGTLVTFHVFVPTGAPVDFVQPYIQEDVGAPTPYRFTPKYIGGFTSGTWLTIDVPAPVDVTPLIKVGVQFHLTTAYNGNVYVDSVNWPMTP